MLFTGKIYNNLMVSLRQLEVRFLDVTSDELEIFSIIHSKTKKAKSCVVNVNKDSHQKETTLHRSTDLFACS